MGIGGTVVVGHIQWDGWSVLPSTLTAAAAATEAITESGQEHRNRGRGRQPTKEQHHNILQIIILCTREWWWRGVDDGMVRAGPWTVST